MFFHREDGLQTFFANFSNVLILRSVEACGSCCVSEKKEEKKNKDVDSTECMQASPYDFLCFGYPNADAFYR